ncbi:spore coat U domain-containing protein [Brucella sp. 21LCYQ03]|nr:spore coat U domain-containing protein [Brucella sp. 21LCYQ03]
MKENIVSLKLKTITLSTFIALTALIHQAHATDASGKLAVRLTVVGSCSIDTRYNKATLDFGNLIDTNTAAINKQTEDGNGIGVQCTKDLSYSIFLNGGLNPLTPASQEGPRMKNGTNYLSYALYQDAARTKVWGWDNKTTNGVSAKGSGSRQKYPVYGTILKQATPAAGAYTDTVTVKVSF